MRYTICIEVEVTDEAALRKAAIDSAVANGETEEEATERLTWAGNYLIQLFDPGDSPPGTQIDCATVDY